MKENQINIALRALPESLQDKSWRTKKGNVTSTDLARFLANLALSRDPEEGIADSRSDDRFNKVSQLAKSSDLVMFAESPTGGGKTWQLTMAAKTALLEASRKK